MKRLVVITVGKTHSGKSTFARELEKELENAFVLDQDNHAEFINTYYQKLQPKTGPNTLKHAISKLIADYAIENTDLHIIASSANRTRKGRKYLLEEVYDIRDVLLLARLSCIRTNEDYFSNSHFNILFSEPIRFICNFSSTLIEGALSTRHSATIFVTFLFEKAHSTSF
ncbi:AAA family ATPase [Ornithinibacillus sp. JPR2-1]|uniref:AAA family ATPase n=1 Tax=Ornithinibacillus sp. JPR2-1 TaxID=2094019 RepID=UPI0031DF756C